MSDDALPFGKDAKPVYPETVKRGRLSPAQKEALKEAQGHCCALCGMKPRRWEWDHKIEVWEGGRSDTIDNWQGLGSRDDCRCHVEKSGKAAKRRAKMNRLRQITGQIARRKARGPSLQSNRKLEGAGFAAKPENFISPLSKEHRGYRNRGFQK